MTFWTRISTSEPSGGAAQDFLNATLQDSDGDFRATLRLYSNQDASSSYVRRQFNLENFIGDTVRLHFLGTTNNDSQPTTFRIDDVSLEVELPEGTAPTVTTLDEDQVTATSARLNMTVDSNGLSTEVWFDFEAGDSTPDPDTEHIGVGNGSNLRPSAIQSLVLSATRSTTQRGERREQRRQRRWSQRFFQTDECPVTPPRADTDPANQITEIPPVYRRDTPERGYDTSMVRVGNRAQLGRLDTLAECRLRRLWRELTHTLTGLGCDTTYYFEAHAQRSAGHDDGATLAFTTSPCDEPVVSDQLLLFAERAEAR